MGSPAPSGRLSEPLLAGLAVRVPPHSMRPLGSLTVLAARHYPSAEGHRGRLHLRRCSGRRDADPAGGDCGRAFGSRGRALLRPSVPRRARSMSRCRRSSVRKTWPRLPDVFRELRRTPSGPGGTLLTLEITEPTSVAVRFGLPAPTSTRWCRSWASLPGARALDPYLPESLKHLPDFARACSRCSAGRLVRG